MAATNRYMNFGVFSFAATAVTGVTDFSFDAGISQKDAAGDGDPGPTVRTVDYIDPSFQFTTLDAMALQASLGSKGVFIATLLDAYNKALTAGGAKVFTTNALSILGGSTSSQYRNYGTRQFNVWLTWSDPATPPYAVTAL